MNTVSRYTLYTVTYIQGRPSPLRPWCISPSVSDFPPIFDKFSDSVENFQTFTFSRKMFRFSSAKISDDLFCHTPQISNCPPIFPVSVHFLLFRENYYFPTTLKNFPPVFEKFTCFLHTLCVFRSPLLWPWCIYASPNARTGRPCHMIRLHIMIRSTWGLYFKLRTRK